MMHLVTDHDRFDDGNAAGTSSHHAAAAATATFADHLAVPDQRSVDWRQAGTRLSDMLQKASNAYQAYQATTSHAAAAASFASGGGGSGSGAPLPHSPSRAAPPPQAALQRWGWFRGDLVARRKPEPPSLLFPDAWWGEEEAEEVGTATEPSAAAADQATRGSGGGSGSGSGGDSPLQVPPPEGLSTLARIAASNCVDLAAAPVLEVVRHCWRWQIPFLDPAFPPCTGGGGGDVDEDNADEDGCEAAAWVRVVPASSVCSFSSPDLPAPATLADVRRVCAAGEGGAFVPGVPGWLPACAAAMLHAGKRLPAVRRLEAGAVQARLCGAGCWAPVVTDPYVPLCGDGGGDGGVLPDEGRAWMLLVAKCFAKVVGGYRALAEVEGAASTPGEVLEAFTGAPYSVLAWPPPGNEERAALEALLARGCPAVATLASGEGRGGNVHAALLGHREFLGRSVALLAAVPQAQSGGGERRRQPWEGAAGFANPPGCRWTSSEGIRNVAVCHTAAAEDTVRVRVSLKEGAPVQIVEARGRETAVAGRGGEKEVEEVDEDEDEDEDEGGKDADAGEDPVEVTASVLHPVHPVALLALCESAERRGEWRVEASSVEGDGGAGAGVAATRRVHFTIPPGSRCVVVCRPLTEDGDQEVWVSLAAARPLAVRALLPTRHGVLLPLGFFGERHPRAGKVFRGVPPDSLDVSYCPVTQVETQWDGACSTDVPAGRRGAA